MQWSRDEDALVPGLKALASFWGFLGVLGWEWRFGGCGVWVVGCGEEEGRWEGSNFVTGGE